MFMFEFSKTNRLTKKKEFESVFNLAKKVQYKYFTALHSANQNEQPRLGIMVPKRHFKHAKDRNQIRRIIRESFRYNKEKLKGLDIVLLIRSECSPLDKKALRADINNLWGFLKPSC